MPTSWREQHTPARPGSGAPYPAELREASAPFLRSPGRSDAVSGGFLAAPLSGTPCAVGGGTQRPVLKGRKGIKRRCFPSRPGEGVETGPGGRGLRRDSYNAAGSLPGRPLPPGPQPGHSGPGAQLKGRTAPPRQRGPASGPEGHGGAGSRAGRGPFPPPSRAPQPPEQPRRSDAEPGALTPGRPAAAEQEGGRHARLPSAQGRARSGKRARARAPRTAPPRGPALPAPPRSPPSGPAPPPRLGTACAKMGVFFISIAGDKKTRLYKYIVTRAPRRGGQGGRRHRAGARGGSRRPQHPGTEGARPARPRHHGLLPGRATGGAPEGDSTEEVDAPAAQRPHCERYKYMFCNSTEIQADGDGVCWCSFYPLLQRKR